MITFADNRIGFDFDRCQQCGACLAVCPTRALTMTRTGDGVARIAVDQNACIRCKKCFNCCPANKVDNFDNYFKNISAYRYILAHNAEPDIRSASSSGGVCKTLIVQSLKQGLVDGVYSLATLPDYPMARGEFYTQENIPEYQELPNSVYHSVMQCLELSRVKRVRRLMIVGTACQLRALSTALKGHYDEIVKVCIFCKQQKTLASTRFLAKVAGTKLPPDLKFSATYRGGGWPGTVTINGHTLPYHRAAQLPFGRRLFTVRGCNVCGDPFGLIAGTDITLMDPWEIMPHTKQGGSTLVTLVSEKGAMLFHTIDSLQRREISFAEAEQALGLKDIRRKQLLTGYFRGIHTSKRVRLAGIAEQTQRAMLTGIVEILPRMPMLFYRVLCKLPDFRNLILR